jgi:hypothetical protein
MTHYDYQDTFKKLYDKAVAQFESGNRDKATYFDDDELAAISANGWRVQDFFDYAEDAVEIGEPSYEVAQSIEQVRREYFLHMQNSQPTGNTLDSSTLPGKTESLEGYVWLPRILPKARAKLLGELPDDTMYSCGGDRRFLKTNDIHPSEFLRVVWANLDDDAGVLEFVKKRNPQTDSA